MQTGLVSVQKQPPSRSTSVLWWSPPSPRLTPQPKPTTNRSPAARTSPGPGARPPRAPKTAEPRRKSPFDHGRGRRMLSSCQHPATSSSKHVMQRAGVTTSPRLPRVWPYATNRSDLAHGARAASITLGRRSERESFKPAPREDSWGPDRITVGLPMRHAVVDPAVRSSRKHPRYYARPIASDRIGLVGSPHPDRPREAQRGQLGRSEVAPRPRVRPLSGRPDRHGLRRGSTSRNAFHVKRRQLS